MIPVYDKANKDRLLGYHPRIPGWGKDGEHYRLMTYQQVCHHQYYTSGSMNLASYVVTFERVPKITDNGWKAEVVLVTSDPLETLMALRDFRLPGKSEAKAERRWFYA